jgi:DNA polymerase V
MIEERLFALVDCNNFFASCERLFRPDLGEKPVVVLSSNDGCVVARSNESKALGVPMGAPAFQWRDFFKEKSITTFSANFEIYGNISRRITSVLSELCPRIEVYSVDESFLDITHLPNVGDGTTWAKHAQERIAQEIGVPVSVGIATSKTLAKLASEFAKKHLETGGVVSFIGNQSREELLAATEIRNVWGVGRNLAPKFRAEGIGNALTLSKLRPQRAQQLMGVRGRQLVAELNGVCCYDFAAEHDAAKSILRSRTFGEDTNEVHVLEAAVASLTTSAAFALRKEHLLTQRIGVFANTNRHKPGYQRFVEEIKLDQPTNDTGRIISLLVARLSELHAGTQKFHRLGVFVYDLMPEGSLQTDFFGLVKTKTHDAATARMAAIDAINKRHGKGKLHFAAEDLSKSWQPKHEIRSPRYLSNWGELPEARII